MAVLKRPRSGGFLGSLMKGLGTVASFIPGGQVVGAALGAAGALADGDFSGAAQQGAQMFGGNQTAPVEQVGDPLSPQQEAQWMRAYKANEEGPVQNSYVNTNNPSLLWQQMLARR